MAAMPPVATAPFINARRLGSETSSTTACGAPVGVRISSTVAFTGCLANAPKPIIAKGAAVSMPASIKAALRSSGLSSVSAARPLALIPRIRPCTGSKAEARFTARRPVSLSSGGIKEPIPLEFVRTRGPRLVSTGAGTSAIIVSQVRQCLHVQTSCPVRQGVN